MLNAVTLSASLAPEGYARKAPRERRPDSGPLGLSNKCFTGCHRFHFLLSTKIAVAVVNPPQPPLATLPLPLSFTKFQNLLAVREASRVENRRSGW